LNRGVDFGKLRAEFGAKVDGFSETISELTAQGLLQNSGQQIQLTARGRLLSNNVFERFIANPATMKM
jgi:oxygen-independent coproporphyrinogen-3 oxidase